MKLAHLADLHLGRRQFDRTTAGGQNQREADVAIALRRTVDDLIAERPDVIVIAGDVFHSVRPPNSAILTLFTQLQRLRPALPDTRVIVIAGNHDTPRSSESGFILPLFTALGVDVTLLKPAQFRLSGVTITAVPSAAATAIPEPDPAAAMNVLVVHGDVPGFGAPAPLEAVHPQQLERAGWDYVALGHYHVAAQVGPRAWYAGSIEYTSTDPWSEIRKQAELGVDGKGYLMVELPGGTPRFRPIGPTRRFLDLASIDAQGLGAEDLDRVIAERVAGAEIDGAVVRLVVRGVSREVRRGMNHTQVRTWKARALNFHLAIEWDGALHRPLNGTVRFASLEEQLGQFLKERPLPADIDRAAFREAGEQYFRSAGLNPGEDPYTGERVA